MKTVSEITGLRRMGPVALIDVNRDAWDALEALGMDPEAPMPDLNRVAFQQYARARRGGFFDPAIPWEDQTPHTRGKLIDCWELFLEYRNTTGIIPGFGVATPVDWPSPTDCLNVPNSHIYHPIGLDKEEYILSEMMKTIYRKPVKI